MRLTILLLFVTLTCSGQYSELKKQYNYKDYTPQQTDKYIPAFAGVMSAVIPGSGQMYCGETARGFKYLFGSVLGAAAFMGGYNATEYNSLFGQDATVVSVTAFVGLGVFLYSYIGGIVDAPKVAKVKNMSSRISASSQGVGIVIRF